MFAIATITDIEISATTGALRERSAAAMIAITTVGSVRATCIGCSANLGARKLDVTTSDGISRRALARNITCTIVHARGPTLKTHAKPPHALAHTELALTTGRAC